MPPKTRWLSPVPAGCPLSPLAVPAPAASASQTSAGWLREELLLCWALGGVVPKVRDRPCSAFEPCPEPGRAQVAVSWRELRLGIVACLSARAVFAARGRCGSLRGNRSPSVLRVDSSRNPACQEPVGPVLSEGPAGAPWGRGYQCGQRPC